MTTYKWAVWRRMLHVELACYLVWVLAFQAFVLIFQARRRLPMLSIIWQKRPCPIQHTLGCCVDSHSGRHVMGTQAHELLRAGCDRERAAA